MLQSSNFDMTLKPLIPVTRSCNSLMRKIKYNLYSDKNSKFPISQLLLNIKNNTHILNKSSGENSENGSICDKTSIEKSGDMNSFKSKIIDENKQNESTVKVLKTVFVNGDSFPVNVKQQSNEDETQVNIKKLKSTEKNVILCISEDLHSFNSPSSSFDKLDCSNAQQTHSAECSYTPAKGSKRTLSTSFNETDICKRISKTKSRHEKNLTIGNQNQNIDSDCQNNSKLDYVTLQNTNDLLLEHSENSIDSCNVDSCLVNESLVRENKWVTKVSSPELTVDTALNLKYSQNNFLGSDKDETVEKYNISKGTESNRDQDGMFSPPSYVQWPLKLSPCDPGSPECKPTINSSEQMEIDVPSSNTVGINSPKTEHLLSLSHSEELISKLVSSRHSVNENEHTQMYALPIDQKPTHVEHPYVENTINSNTRDLEVVNVLSPVSINSTDIPINKSSWVPDMSLIHAPNDHNDIDGDHSQPPTQQLNGLCNSINSNRISNYNSEVEHFNHIQLETPVMARSFSYSLIEPRIYSDDSYNLSPNESSVSNSAYGSMYDVSRISAVSLKTLPVSLASNDVMHELNDSSNSIYRGNTINHSFNGLNTKCNKEQQSYNFAMNKTRQSDLGSIDQVSSIIKDRNDKIDVVSDVFSDVDSMDLRITCTEPNENKSCLSSLQISNLISTDLKSVNSLSSFNQSLSWSTIKNPSEPSNLHQKQKLKIYSDPNELISGPLNLNKQSGMSINLNEAHVQKVFLGNKSPSQVYYSPIDMDIGNHGNVDDSKLKQFANRPNSQDHVSKCTNDKYIHSVLSSTDNEPNINNGLMYKFATSDSKPSVGFENPLQLQHTNPDCLSPNGLTLKSLDPMAKLGPILLEDCSLKEEQAIVNMAQLMIQPSKNCKVHYKWPLNKNKNQVTASNAKVQETPQNVGYKRNVLLSKYTDDELNQIRLQNMSPNEILNQNSSLSFNERNNDSAPFQSNQQFQDISNLIESDVSPTINSGSDSMDENNSRKELTDQQETMYRNPKMSNQSQETSTTLSRKVFEAARYLFNEGKLFLCMHPKCTNSHHFRVIPSNAEMLRHEFTVPFDDFRFNIQYKYKQLLTSNPRTWPNIPVLVQLNKRCLCEICGDFDSKLNQNQEMLHTYVEGKKPSIEEDNNENEFPTNPQLRLSWKKNLANRFSSEAIAKQSISQMIDDMERHIQRFTCAFTIIFALNKDVETNSQNLQNACESYSDVDNDGILLNSECVTKLDIAHKYFNKDLQVHSYQYLQLPKIIPKYVLEELSNSSYQPPNHNTLNIPHQFDEEHLPNEINRYFVENSTSPSYNPNLTNQSLKYVHENIPNISHQPAVDNLPSTSHQTSVGNLTNSSYQPVLNKFPTTSHGISSLNDRTQKHSHMSCYYSDSQIYTDFPHTYIPVPSAQFGNSSTNSYYNSPVNMPSDNSVPFCSPSLSVNSVPHSPSSDCSIPSLVETVATAVPEHALLDDSLEAVNAAHNLMLISNRHRYNSTASISTKKNADTITITTSTTTKATITNTNISTNDTKTNKMSTSTTKNSIAQTTTAKNLASPNTVYNNNSTTCTMSNTLSSIKTEPDDEDSDIIHNSRKKKKKKHDKKKDKKKKGKR